MNIKDVMAFIFISPLIIMFLGTALQDVSLMRIVSDATDPYECLQDLIILHQAKINFENGSNI